MFSLKKISVFVLAGLISNAAFAEHPMLQEGKTSVFQRVVSNPNASLYKDVGGQSKIRTPRTFTSFYVYERKGG